jgi:hypothetical protein
MFREDYPQGGYEVLSKTLLGKRSLNIRSLFAFRSLTPTQTPVAGEIHPLFIDIVARPSFCTE